MSTVSTMSSASTSPSGLGQSRRGHNRSRQWSQSANSFAISQKDQSLAETRSTQSNGHTSKSNRSSGHQHMTNLEHHHGDEPGSSFPEDYAQKREHQHSLGEQHSEVDWNKVDQGNPRRRTTVSLHQPLTKWKDLHPSYEIMTGILTALPWVVLSWYLRPYSEQTSRKIHRILKQAASMNENSLPVQNFDTKVDAVLWRTTALVAVTLLIVGVWSVMRRRKAGHANPDMLRLPFVGWDFETGKAAITTVLSLGLPIYAAMKVGGVMVALSLALTYSTGLPTIFEERETGANQSRDRIGQKKATLFMLAVFVIICILQLDVPPDVTPMKGYAALAVSIFLLRPPFAKAYDATQLASRQNDDSNLNFTGPIQSLLDQQASAVLLGPLNSTSADIRLTLLSGASLAAVSLIWGTFSGNSSLFGMVDIIYLVGTASSFAAGLVISSPMDLRTRKKKGFIVTCVILVFFGALPHAESSRIGYLVRMILGGLSYFASIFDDPKSYSMLGTNERNSRSDDESSTFTRFLLQHGESFPVLYSILSERDSRRIFYFMILNFTFMLVQLSYGFITGSLGLLSDSIHMFFDCLALVVGLSAAVMSRWPPSERFPYGYGKVDTLSGFANGIFLMIISVEIVYEAIERLLSGSEMHRLQELLVVSLAGLVVNLVGIMAFDHAHSHSHGDHGHGHSHANENMHGIFLHILADTMGSVAVVISTILVHFYGWTGFDPIASCIIAILIFASAVPLVCSTAKSLLLTLPDDVEYSLRDTLGGLSGLRGVVGYAVPKFWLDDTAKSEQNHHVDHHHHHHHHHHHDHHDHHSHEHSHDATHNTQPSHKKHDHGVDHDHNHGHHHDHHGDHHHDHHSGKKTVLGVIHVIALRGADLEDVRRRTVAYLEERKMNVLVQVEREGDSRCWCGNGLKGS